MVGLFSIAGRQARTSTRAERQAGPGEDEMTQVTGQAAAAAGEDAGFVIGHWIDGRISTPDGRSGDIFDPALGLRRATVRLADRRTVDDAVAAATRAFETWRDVPITRRTPILYRFRDLLIDHIDELAAAISSEHGKVPGDAAGEIHRGLEVVEMACSVPAMLKGEHSEQVAGGVDTFSVRQPVGVCAGITPFNFPAMVPLWMFPIALACGNTFVPKPSWPKPAQRPHPPVLVGGIGPKVLDRALSFGDAWFPNYRGERIVERGQELRARADRPIELMVAGMPADPAELERFAEAGFSRAVHWLPAAPRAGVERALERWEATIAEFTGEA
jgi:hypothetical protein